MDLWAISFASARPNPAEPSGPGSELSSSSRPTVPTCEVPMEGEAAAEEDTAPGGMQQPSSSSRPGPEPAEDDNMTICPSSPTSDETDEARGELAASLADHYAAIAAMNLPPPPLPQPLQKSKRQVERESKNKIRKKSHKQRLRLACKSRSQPPGPSRWA